MFKILVHLYNYAESYTVILVWILIPLFIYLAFRLFKYNETQAISKKITQPIGTSTKEEKPTKFEEQLPTSNESEEAINLLTQAMSEFLEDEKTHKGEEHASD